jgi:uncharacterized protein YndB with AHSA1/START domain
MFIRSVEDGMENKGQFNLKVDAPNRAVVITRVFDAPRDLVFKVLSDPKLVPQWWGPRNLTTHVDKMDVKPGGAWRYVQHDSDGHEFAFHGVYREVVPPERLVYTFEYEPMAGHEIIETVTLEDVAGKTKVTSRDVYQSIEDLEAMVKSGMEFGARESFERFTELLETEGVAR